MARSVPRELFPLPHMPEEDQPSSRLSRGVRQRVDRRRAVASRVKETIDALNSLMGFSSSSASRPSLAQRKTLERLHAQHVSDLPQIDFESSEEACAALLGLGRATAAYGGDAAPHIFAPYDRSLLSIPGSGTQPAQLEDILDKHDRERIVGYREHLLISADDWGALCEKGDNKIASYTDPRLRGHSDDYKGFVEDLFHAGLINFTWTAQGIISPFCVWKKNGRQRLVLDCRAVSRLFKRSAHIPLGSGSAWADIVLEPDTDLYISQSDIKDNFYRCGVPAGLSRLFCLPSVPTRWLREWGVKSVDSTSPEEGALCYHSFLVLPMGWSWAFYFAQKAHVHQVQTCFSFSPDRVLVDRRPRPDFRTAGVASLPYCDNLNILGGNPVEVAKARLQVTAHLDE